MESSASEAVVSDLSGLSESSLKQESSSRVARAETRVLSRARGT